MTDGVEIIAGTYEEFLVGYKIKNADDEIELTHSFATHAHAGSIKCVASSGRYVASGGADDKIVVHDMTTRTENKVLLHHDGTVRAVAFAHDSSHIFSAGSDGSLYAHRTGSWTLEKHWPNAHKGAAVTNISIHPSDKLALTVGDDHSLRTWNLIKGRQAYVTNLKSKGAANPLSVSWSPEGRQFALTGYNDVTVWSVANATVERTLKCPSKAICMDWISENLPVIGLENGQIAIFDLESEEKHCFEAHSQRIKGIAYRDKYLYTASSFGDIKVWRFKLKKMKLIEKASVETDCRITCLTIVPPVTLKWEKFENLTDLVTDEAHDEGGECEVVPVEPERPAKNLLKSYVTVEDDEPEADAKHKKKKKKVFENNNKRFNKIGKKQNKKHFLKSKKNKQKQKVKKTT